jgi:hypothetical protein
LGAKENVTVTNNNIMVNTKTPVKLDVRFPQLRAVQADVFEDNQPSVQGGDEKHTLLRIPGAPGAGYFWVMFPRAEGEQAPVLTTPAPGVMKIVHAEGTDYAFLSATPISYQADGLLFNGCAGAIRLAKDGSVTLALSGGRGKVGYKGTILSGVAPFEKTYAPNELKAGVTVLPVPATTITMNTKMDAPQALVPGRAGGRSTRSAGLGETPMYGPRASPLQESTDLDLVSPCLTRLFFFLPFRVFRVFRG